MIALLGVFQDDDDHDRCEVCRSRITQTFFVLVTAISGTGFFMGDLCPECITAVQQIIQNWLNRLLPL